jgi:hypothetical protein
LIQRASLTLLLAAISVAFTQSRSIPPWEAAAGGKMEFEVASIHLSKPGTPPTANFSLSADDAGAPPQGTLTADLPLEAYIFFAYKNGELHDQRKGTQ